MNTSEILAALPGLTYRQFDHWITKGYIKPRARPDGRSRLGYERSLTPKEYRVLKLMHELVQAGISPEQAIKMARRYERGYPLELGEFTLIRGGARSE